MTGTGTANATLPTKTIDGRNYSYFQRRGGEKTKNLIFTTRSGRTG